MADNSRRHISSTRDLESLLQPIPGWEAEWIHLGPGRRAIDGVRVTFGSGTFTALQTSSAGILRGITSRDSVALLGEPPATTSPAQATRNRSAATPACVLGPAAAPRSLSTAGQRRHDLRRARVACRRRQWRRGESRLSDCVTGQGANRPAGALHGIAAKRSAPRPASSRSRATPAPTCATVAVAAADDVSRRRATTPIGNAARLQRHLAVIRACELRRCASARADRA